jgi:preprotein translocase subunit SecE
MSNPTATNPAAPHTNRQLALLRYLRDSRIELKKVTWPSREQTVNLTIVVLVVCIAIALFLGGLDYLFASLVKWIA